MEDNINSAIEERNSKKIKSELTFVGIKSSTIEKFDKTAEALFFTVKFVSEIISVKKDGDNKIIEGDPNKIKTVNISFILEDQSDYLPIKKELEKNAKIISESMQVSF